ncbi:acetyl-CoA carboxylase biotin carboxylase subunit [Gammaproteobacteria bacterium]|jgi:acetyl-CoA carboxylase biotin carboxylase subunit|nr:acetyl-CoA carboxylase biotin carboxylase subunit [Gammaproteobacteria bacterium]MDA9342516.1 acetyl-CoA carboxylase biotin carboxylase subunit [Gammaproteobacteria bacterium]MDA9355907.1 acetyl-CoA carboxylase biotin carboxylase subunit [Gammaproteobacteria bacterium]MDB2582483.1 acetyl-CoA carboxylase biotin carboxylase subunit [Gammaproteobacteria bacterium]MDB4119980.1 acetyl-CoA carboxylase biotin carboxylase subunit [Gammaproteobacteria bacterium]|tara:strand:+ start:827 stop:2179 length:1353 start_codon:yes stop_codon:yes gene_type:complete
MSFKVLIANRGEIALRAIRACKELGISTVSVYSEGDKDLKHLRFSDETVCIGPTSPLESYLNIPSILSAAELTQVDAIYPGYGFLAEDPDFAEMCQKSGFKFIGPDAKTIRKMGDKITAKTLAEKAGIQTVPGYKDEIPEDPEKFKAVARDVGYPIMIKATAGGGGRGMRVVEKEEDLITLAQITMQEAKNAFGNETIYLEKFIANPRHVEVQVVGDGKGKAIHLGTRDCSMQRRHQKIIEEAPALNLNEVALEKIFSACIKLCESINYEGAGTLEFLYENDNFYFIEMNTRIQVEHPVTEMITGFDIVKAQMRIALGMKFEIDQSRINFKGHALECRINAEDPETFQPSPGTITKMHTPGGFGVRYDSHIYGGYIVPPYYDSLLAKIITQANSRESAIKRMLSALDEFFIEGIKTNHSLHQKLLRDEVFINNKHTINYLENEFLKKHES